jgi:predicted  nucleic acid-binding Zn-ribbon protein
MVKPEWGAKHGCPKCGTRFYDLGKSDPVTCIECGYAWTPEPVLKSKQPIPYEEIQKKADEDADGDLADDDLDIDDDGDRRTTTLTWAATTIWAWPATTTSRTKFKVFRLLEGISEK